jgi:GntR family transcriptional regulator/MocR family aminotransferase
MEQRPSIDLLIALDPRARGALQSQIYAGLRRAILDGVVQPGMRLPSSRALASDLGVSRTTSLLALEQLVAEGYLTPRPGSGTFVANELPDDLPGARGSRPPRRRGTRRSRNVGWRSPRRGPPAAAWPAHRGRFASASPLSTCSR